MLLKTLGHPALERGDRPQKGRLQRKDLALLIYLCVEGLPMHARGRLASLLWGESPDRDALHSLSQALTRLKVQVPGSVVPDTGVVRWCGGLECDAAALLRGTLRPEDVDDDFSVYAGHFLEGFAPRRGAEDFNGWADRRRPEIRNAALRLLERAGEQAEAAGAWTRALRLGERAVEIDPVWEQGHRRVMRALATRGERNAALRYYQQLEVWLREDVGGEPDPDTRALAEQLRAPDVAEPRPAAPNPPPLALPGPAPTPVVAGPAGEDPDPPHPIDPPADPPAVSPAGAGGGNDDGDRHGVRIWLAMVLGGVLMALMALLVTLVQGVVESRTEKLPVHGESVRLRGTDRVYLAFGETLYEYPDSSTLSMCTGWYPEVVREIRSLPPWPRRTLPSAQHHRWMGGTAPVVSDDPVDRTAYVPVGCVLSVVRTPQRLDSIFGPGAAERIVVVHDSVLDLLPLAFVARAHPLRPAGTLIRGPEDRVRWITYHGGALEVTDPQLLATRCRSAGEAVPVAEREFRYYRPWGTLGRGPGDCRGDPSFGP